jgi:hypothetical protein
MTPLIISYAAVGITFDRIYRACSLVTGVKLIRLIRKIKNGKIARIK